MKPYHSSIPRRCCQWLGPSRRTCLLMLPLLLAGVVALADGNPPERMTYQGYVTDGNGNALAQTAPKNYDVIFRIYDDQSAGNLLWGEQQTVTVDRGYFSVLLGEGSAGGDPHQALSSLFTNSTASDRFVEIMVRGIGSGGTDAIISPRLRLMTSPYAFLARNAVNATMAASLVNSGNGQVVSVKGSNVGINQANPAQALDVTGTIHGSSLKIDADASAGSLAVAGNGAVGGSLSVSGALTASSVTTAGVQVSGNVTAATVSAGTVSGNGTIPVGGIIMWNGATPPAGWALCDGGTYSGRTTPDLRGRFVLGAGNGSGLTGRSVGQSGGEEKHTLSPGEMPSHSHSISVNTVGYAAAWNGSAEATAAPGQGRNNGWRTWYTSGAGSNEAHNTMPPYYVLAFIMRVQ